ncbi:MAG: hypothetical protein ACKVQT_28770 [Burkholderiales bacterium]
MASFRATAAGAIPSQKRGVGEYQYGTRAVGKATHVVKLMTDYARERRHFGQAIGDYQMIQ